ncbi:PREDICTED: uncharacterized protein LOC106125128 [Papilio xuthus]|uniref:Uncharacterized protein LOC106125128 n=1 Tax=Papilio xuthus TaxID=66420 RepID=A0AAJ6ZR45_PAPXU|nr:PREDICTED: uncharacterized protein LOC106125128 [Papilio xuthus]
MKNIWFYGLLYCLKFNSCVTQKGPDPWDYESHHLPPQLSENIPPDLRHVPKKIVNTENNVGMSEWFFKRMLVIVLKGGQVKENEDNTVDVALQMKFNDEQWALLNQYTMSDTQLTEDNFRRTIGYIENSIYKPSITEKVVMAWNEYIQIYLSQYKVEITWVLGLLSVKLAMIWLLKRMSHQHMMIILFATLYLYEVFVSYKEAEKQDLERFLSAINKCKWIFWSSECDVPPPDPLIFLKHMNPLKIGIRIFTTLISEPMLIISDTIKIMIHGITDGLWFPLDKIMFGLLIIIFNTLLIFLLIMVIFNYILNIPFNLSFLGLINIGLKSRNRSFIKTNEETLKIDDGDRISGPRLDRLLDICSRALSTQHSGVSHNGNTKLQMKSGNSTLKRSASTGRLPSLQKEWLSNNMLPIENNVKKNNIRRRNNKGTDGSGDA